MRIRLTAKRAEIDDCLRDYINKKLIKLNTFAHNIMEAQVVLDEEKYMKTAEIIVRLKKASFVSKHTSNDFYQSVDAAFHGVGQQLRRRMDKVKARRRRFAFARTRRALAEFFGY